MPFPSHLWPPSRPACLGPARSGVSGKPYRRLSRDKGAFDGGKRTRSRGRRSHVEQRWGERGLGGPIGVTSQKEISLLDLPCPLRSSNSTGAGALVIARGMRTYCTVQPSLYGLGLCGRSARFTWAGGPAPRPSPLHSLVGCLSCVFPLFLLFSLSSRVIDSHRADDASICGRGDPCRC